MSEESTTRAIRTPPPNPAVTTGATTGFSTANHRPLPKNVPSAQTRTAGRVKNLLAEESEPILAEEQEKTIDEIITETTAA